MAQRYTFVDDSDDVRLSGYLTPDPGGSQPVTDGTTTGILARVPMGTLTDLGGGEVAMGLILQQIGPATMVWNDMGSEPEDTGLRIPPGAILLKAFMVVSVEGTTVDTPALFGLILAPADNFTIGHSLVVYDLWNGEFSPETYFHGESVGQNSTDPGQVLLNTSRSGVAIAETAILAQRSQLNLIDGTSEIYAIIATPTT